MGWQPDSKGWTPSAQTSPDNSHQAFKDREEYLVIQTAEAVGDVPLDEPSRALTRPLDLRERRMATPSRTETVGSVAELGIVVRLQDEADHLLQQLVREGREPERARLLRALFLDVDAPRW